MTRNRKTEHHFAARPTEQDEESGGPSMSGPALSGPAFSAPPL